MAIKFEEVFNGIIESQKPFKSLKGLNKWQQIAMFEFGFDNSEVLSKEFGEHTVIGIAALMKKGKTAREALKMVRGLNKFQTHGVAFENLTRNQVKDINSFDGIEKLVTTQTNENVATKIDSKKLENFATPQNTSSPKREPLGEINKNPKRNNKPKGKGPKM